MTDHIFGSDGEIAKEPTCTEPGQYKQVCDQCDEELITSIPATATVMTMTSLSTRREWIEIWRAARRAKPKTSLSTRREWIEIRTISTMCTRFWSLSTRREWIEMSDRLPCWSRRTPSLSTRREWIEICSCHSVAQCAQAVLCCKTVIVIVCKVLIGFLDCQSLHRGCGLKWEYDVSIISLGGSLSKRV